MEKTLKMGLKMSEDATKMFGGILNSLDLTLQALEDMETASKGAFDDTTIKSARSEIRDVQAQLIQTNEQIKKAEDEQKKYTEEVERSKSATTGLKQELTEVAMQASALALGAKSMRKLKDEVIEGKDVFRGFEKQLDTVGAVIGASAEEMNNLNQLAIRQSGYFRPEESGKAMEELARRGWKYHDLLVGLNPVQNLAIGNEIELGRAAEISADILNQYHFNVDQTERVVNALSYAAANASTDVDLLGSSMAESASLAKTFGMEFEELLALISMEAASAKGSKAGRFIRTGLLDLANMSDTAKATAEALEVDFIDPVTKDFKDIRTILGDLNVAFEDLNNAAKLQAAQNIFGTQGANAWLEIIGQGTEEFDKWMKGFEEMGDFAYNQAQRMMDNLDGLERQHLANREIAWINFYSRLEEMGALSFVESYYEILEKLQEQVLILLEVLIYAVNFFDEMFMGAMSEMFEVIGPIIGSTIGLFLTLFTVTTIVGKGFGLLWGIMQANPMLAIISLIASIVLALVRLWRTNDEFAIAWYQTWNNIANFMDRMVNRIIRGVNSVIKALNKLPGVDIGVIDERDIGARDAAREQKLQNFISKREQQRAEEDITKELMAGIDLKGDPAMKDIGRSLGNLEDIGKGGNKKLKGLKESVDVSNEDIKLLRDIAEERVINRFTTQTISPEISVEFSGDVDKDTDIEGIVTEITDRFIEKLQSGPEGVYE